MKYLIWLSQVKAYIAEHYPEGIGWDKKGGWRDAFHANKSPREAAYNAYDDGTNREPPRSQESFLTVQYIKRSTWRNIS